MSNIGRTIRRAWCSGFISKNYDLDGARVEAEGFDWVVVRTLDGQPYFEQFDKNTKQQWLDEFYTPTDEEQ